MNSFAGTIREVQFYDGLAFITIQSGEVIFSSIVLEEPSTAPHLRNKHPVRVLFNENEVILATTDSRTISMRNKIPCVIGEVEEGKLLSRITLEASIGTLYSVITTRSMHDLQLKTGGKVWAYIKTTEVQLGK